MDKKIGERMKSVRLENGLSQAEFAEKLDVSLPTINRFERGHRTPDADFIVKMGDVFGCDILWVLTGKASSSFEAKTMKTPLLRRIPDELSAVQPEDVASHICFPRVPDDTYAIQIAGDDLLPTIREGDFVFFRPVKMVAGDIVLYVDAWGKTKARRLRNEGEAMLVAEHPDYPPIKVDKEIKLVGKVVQVLRAIIFSD